MFLPGRGRVCEISNSSGENSKLATRLNRSRRKSVEEKKKSDARLDQSRRKSVEEKISRGENRSRRKSVEEKNRTTKIFERTADENSERSIFRHGRRSSWEHSETTTRPTIDRGTYFRATSDLGLGFVLSLVRQIPETLGTKIAPANRTKSASEPHEKRKHKPTAHNANSLQLARVNLTLQLSRS
jgi:hypothetical protein